MKLRGLLLSCSLLLLVNSPINALAGSVKHKDYKGMAMAQEVSGFVGWSAGLGLGLNNYDTNTTMQTITRTFDNPFLSGVPGDSWTGYARANVNKFGPMANLYAGYGYLRDIYYVGANAGLNLVGAKMLNANETTASNINIADTTDVTALYYLNTLTTQTKLTRSWIEPFFDVKVGGLITPETLSYGIIGVSVDSVTMRSITIYDTNATVVGAPPAANTSTVLNYSKRRYLVGLRLGAGSETLITKKIGVAVQYVYTIFPSFNANGAINTAVAVCDTATGCTTTPAVVTNTTRTALTDQQLMAQFIYHIS